MTAITTQEDFQEAINKGILDFFFKLSKEANKVSSDNVIGQFGNYKVVKSPEGGFTIINTTPVDDLSNYTGKVRYNLVEVAQGAYYEAQIDVHHSSELNNTVNKYQTTIRIGHADRDRVVLFLEQELQRYEKEGYKLLESSTYERKKS